MKAEFQDVDFYKREGIGNTSLLFLYQLYRDSKGTRELINYKPLLSKESPNMVESLSEKGYYKIGNNTASTYDLTYINRDKIHEYINTAIHYQGKDFYKHSYQDNFILEQLGKIFSKREGTLIKFPKEFDIKREEAENFEYIKTLLRLEQGGFINIKLGTSINSMFPRTEYEKHSNIIVEIHNRDSGIYTLKNIVLDFNRKSFTSNGFNIGDILSELKSKDRIGAYMLAGMVFLGKEQAKQQDFSNGLMHLVSTETANFLLRFDERFNHGNKFKNGKKDIVLYNDSFAKLASLLRNFLKTYPNIGYELTGGKHNIPYCLIKTS